MNRVIARAIHETTNITFWMENPEWKTGNPVGDFALSTLRKLPFSIHEFQKNHVFKDSDAITVSGESVVLAHPHTVQKYMFRYPGSMPLDEFYQHVNAEVGAVTSTLAKIAIPTTVHVESADIFKRPFGKTDAVVQTQLRVDLADNPALSLEDLDEYPTRQFDTTANDLDILLRDIQKLSTDHGYYPDIAFSSSNLRKNVHTGNVTLIDVMPIYEDGARLIGDSPSKLPHTLDAIKNIEDFVGKFGA
jgi:hypothetical protein